MNLKPADGQTIDLSKIISTNVRLDRTGSGISWETKENESATLGNVPDGKYVLSEVVAPNGYTTVTDFTFEVKGGKVITASREDGSITVKEDENIISVNDKRTEVSISKVDAANDEELPDATLTLTSAYVTTEQWQKIVDMNTGLTLTDDGDGIYWVSGEEPKNIAGLLCSRQYTLQETAAPNLSLIHI